MKRIIVNANSTSKKRTIKASRNSECTPPSLYPWYHEGTLEEAARLGYDTDYIGTPSTTDMYEVEGYEWVGFIIANAEYEPLLGDSGIGLLDVVVDPQTGELIAATISAGRVMEVDDAEVKRMLG